MFTFHLPESVARVVKAAKKLVTPVIVGGGSAVALVGAMALNTPQPAYAAPLATVQAAPANAGTGPGGKIKAIEPCGMNPASCPAPTPVPAGNTTLLAQGQFTNPVVAVFGATEVVTAGEVATAFVEVQGILPVTFTFQLSANDGSPLISKTIVYTQVQLISFTVPTKNPAPFTALIDGQPPKDLMVRWVWYLKFLFLPFVKS